MKSLSSKAIAKLLWVFPRLTSAVSSLIDSVAQFWFIWFCLGMAYLSLPDPDKTTNFTIAIYYCLSMTAIANLFVWYWRYGSYIQNIDYLKTIHKHKFLVHPCFKTAIEEQVKESYEQHAVRPIYPGWNKESSTKSELFIALLNEEFHEKTSIQYGITPTQKIIHHLIAKELTDIVTWSFKVWDMQINLRNPKCLEFALTMIAMIDVFDSTSFAEKSTFYEIFRYEYLSIPSDLKSSSIFGLTADDLGWDTRIRELIEWLMIKHSKQTKKELA